MANKVKVLIVDDSAFMRKVISDFIKSDDRLEVVGTARNGEDALQKVKELQPNVITMDVEMPVLNGLDALKKIMSDHPLPVVMLSSTTQAGAENTIKAMEYGAVEFIAKPSGAISLDIHKVKDEIINKVYVASKANIGGLNPKVRLEKNRKMKSLSSQENVKKVEQVGNIKKLVCIGTSTGGPRALQEVLTNIPKDIQAPILVVQHMPPGFTKSLATRLDTICSIHVKEAEDGEIIKRGTAYIAPGGYHLTIKAVGTALAVQLDQSETRNGHRPSVDVMYESIGNVKGFMKVAVIMTGMGSDGSQGLRVLKKSGNTVAIAESEETSIVFGMPKSAIATQLVDEIIPLNKIANGITQYIN